MDTPTADDVAEAVAAKYRHYEGERIPNEVVIDSCRTMAQFTVEKAKANGETSEQIAESIVNLAEAAGRASETTVVCATCHKKLDVGVLKAAGYGADMAELITWRCAICLNR